MSSPKSASQSSGAAYGGTGAGAGVSSSRKKATVSSAAVVDEGDEFPTDPLIRSILHTPLLWNIQIIGRRWEKVIETLILALIFLLCTSVRLFSVLRYESVIHEFDPYFNFRTTRYLAAEGYYEFWNWFDIGSWYPLGRVIGQTLFPGLMTTAATAKYVLGLAGIVVDIKDVCVFTAPIVSGFCAISGYLITKEITNQSGAGLLTGLFLGLSPSYMSRSVAGSYDNEAVAIFALVFSFYTFVRAVRSATVFSALLSAFAYAYMVSCWGGYVFVTNTISIFAAAVICLGKLTPRHYVAYCVWYVLGTLLCMNIPFVGFNAVRSSEHLASHAVFIVVNVMFLWGHMPSVLPHIDPRRALRGVFSVGIVATVLLFLFFTLSGRTAWSGRSMTLLDPTYASKYIPIIASVSEHQPPTWSSFLFDLHLPILLFPAGVFIAFHRRSDGLLFAGLYGVLSVYFAGVMVRLMLVLAPAACILGGVALSAALTVAVRYIRLPYLNSRVALKTKLSGSRARGLSITIAIAVFGFLAHVTLMYVYHATWASAAAYSHPSIVLSSRTRSGERVMQDDFREAFYWFRKNTHPDARLMSWWDYGYQSCTMGNRTVLVDNNTWNNTHIATVGKAMASSEEKAYPILQRLDVDYVFVRSDGSRSESERERVVAMRGVEGSQEEGRSCPVGPRGPRLGGAGGRLTG
eukprot:GHVU01139245.1.p1 GENE.GHVU01139245.1~~GHVU01139245.1.p1  ORF type:complete len:689 (+),score=133.13 GHVU01139245.1:274-2340(+)